MSHSHRTFPRRSRASQARRPGCWLPATLAVELLIFAVGVGLYCRTTKPSDTIGSFGLWALVIFLLVVYLGNVFGQPPPNVTVLAWVGQAQWLLVIWAYWIDRHRMARPKSA